MYTEKPSQNAPSPAEIAHGKRALLLLALSAISALLSILLLFHTLNPEGVYVYAYDVTASGEKESGKSSQYHLKDDGIAVYQSGGTTANGTWYKDGSQIVITIYSEKAIFTRRGDKLIEYHEGGGKTVYVRD